MLSIIIGISRAIGIIMLVAIGTSSFGQELKNVRDYVKHEKEVFDAKVKKVRQILNLDKKKWVLTSKPQSVVEISREALYPGIPKAPGSPSEIPNQNCNVIPVSYKTTFDRISCYFTDPYKIFPGAAFKTSSIINMGFEPYTGRSRNPMNITTNIIGGGKSPIVRELRNFDHVSYNAVWVPLLAPKLNGGSTGADFSASIYIAESIEQIQQDHQVLNQMGVSASLKVPIPSVPVTITPSSEVKVTNETINKLSSLSKRNYCVIKFEQIFYSATAATPGYSPLFQGSEPIDPDVVFVSKVNYGRVFMMTVESSATKEQLINAVKFKLENTNSISVDVVGAPVGGTIKNTNTRTDERNYEKIFESSETKVSCFQKGGQVIYEGSDIQAAIQKLKATTEFGPDNIGSPISYTLAFPDFNDAFVNINNSYATTNCGKIYNNAYDVELILDDMIVSNCRDLDNTEDLYGEIKFTWAKAGNNELGRNDILWEKSNNSANHNNFRNGNYGINKKKTLFKGISLEDLYNMQIFVGGKLYDDEGVFNSRIFKCDDCSEFDRDFGKRKLYFKDLSSTTKSIDSLILNGRPQALKFGSDEFFELNFFESNNRNDGRVKFRFKVLVTPR